MQLEEEKRMVSRQNLFDKYRYCHGKEIKQDHAVAGESGHEVVRKRKVIAMMTRGRKFSFQPIQVYNDVAKKILSGCGELGWKSKAVFLPSDLFEMVVRGI